ncbi:hypothetical protein UFOVP1090_18 [uncultured Caudovirales phage]|uniref:Uncharacterized protein n=1 Tax=uncultured Caudovirales phage TaxID=2100421 RepID=A0A6J5QSS8_9CAUD|nr:hypothetical protein UFOVP1090_18 [uncultured Caudovirales phage]
MAKAEATKATPAPEYDFSQDAGAGFENVKQGDLSIPFLVILQDGSPEVKKTHKDYATKGIKGAQAGMVLNTVTKELYITEPGELGKEPASNGGLFEFIPSMYQKLYVEWKSRESGGGIVESHSDDTLLMKCKKNEKGQDVLPNGNILQTTAYFFGLALTKDGPVRCVIGLSSTQLKKARQWLNMSTAIKLQGPNGAYTPPLFSHKYRLSTTPESNEKGSWYGWQIKVAGRIQDVGLINNAKEIHTQSKTDSSRMLGASAPESVEADANDEKGPF